MLSGVPTAAATEATTVATTALMAEPKRNAGGGGGARAGRAATPPMAMTPAVMAILTAMRQRAMWLKRVMPRQVQMMLQAVQKA